MMEKPSTALLISKEAVRSDVLQGGAQRVFPGGESGFMTQLEDAIASLERTEKPDERPAEKHAELRNGDDPQSPDRIREDRRDDRGQDEHRADEKRSDEDRRNSEKEVRDQSRVETEKRGENLKGDIRELLSLGRKVEKSTANAKTDPEKLVSEHAPRARVIERGDRRESAEAAAFLLQLRRDSIKEPTKEVRAEGEDKKNVTGRIVKEGRERTMQLPQEALVQERTPVKREATTDNHVVVKLNTEKWTVNNAAEGERQPQQKHGRGDRDSRDLAAERRVHLASREVRTENADANSRTMFLDSMNSLRDPLRGMDRLEEKARVAQDNRNLFNELVEKARLNLGADGRSSASIRMRPEALGTMTLNLRMQEGHLDAKLVVESRGAQKVMMEEIEHLKAELRAQGIQVDSFSIHIRESAESRHSQMQGEDNFQRAGENPEQKQDRNFEHGHPEENPREPGFEKPGVERDLTEESDFVEPLRPIEARFEHVVLGAGGRGVNLSA